MGPAYWRTFVTTPGVHEVRLVALGEAAWSIAPVVRTVTLTRHDTTHVSLNFPVYHRIDSIPLGAAVLLLRGRDRDSLGRTPVTYRAQETSAHHFLVELPGYQSHKVVPGNAIWNRYVVDLTPVGGSTEAGFQSHVRQLHRWPWIEVAAAALVAAGGILSVHHKFRADRLDDDYRVTGDPALRPRIARLDDRAGIALAGMQVGILALGVRFYLRR